MKKASEVNVAFIQASNLGGKLKELAGLQQRLQISSNFIKKLLRGNMKLCLEGGFGALPALRIPATHMR